ncbi:proline dehydrogenase family protein [Psychromicrobium lacuslunae]|uniref:proline dehydrogenase family protein n=1 Tax=Psychromicrobium lacuslunae TaxID=1618207 RepID=UPI0005D3F920|nr:proline dehydrogenase family protein [Psychromicrobium lacuslunae]
MTFDENLYDAEASRTLRRLARSPEYRAAFDNGELLRETLWPAANRYILSEDSVGLLQKFPVLAAKGYRLAVELVGEEAKTAEEIDIVVNEYLALLKHLPGAIDEPVQLGFDLSNLGSTLSWQLAEENTARLLTVAAEQNAHIVLSMENSEQLPNILRVFERLAKDHKNIGITLQAYLHRTRDDIARVAEIGAKVRLVKGVYDEPVQLALPRGEELNRRYESLLEYMLELGIKTSMATHDSAVISMARNEGLLSRVEEVEMLHGVQPGLLKSLKEEGVPCRIYCCYGRSWWLHLLHRLAEHPANVLQSIADIGDHRRTASSGADY